MLTFNLFKTKILFNLTIVSSLVFVISCWKPSCETDNKILLNSDPRSEEYHNELRNLMKNIDSEQFRFWIVSYYTEKDLDFLIIDIRGTNICAKGYLLIEGSSSLQNVIDKRAVSYKGAEISGLKYDYVVRKGTEYLMYVDHEYLID